MSSHAGSGHQVLYRTWRPVRFSDVVGQKHVTRTLRNALLSGCLSHAYLFCGPRGTGKTSVAKILAKAVNCLALREGEPCNECLPCKTIASGQSLDVFEIDAASNRGIDEIRDLREKVKYAPTSCRTKVYIIDEVHMLTTEAFNALLKTLEEPPGHALFILATTDPHKVPATIVSRCQRFNFHRLTPEEIVSRLKEVCISLGVQAEEDALGTIAYHADGGLRDALGLLDQCLVFSTEGSSKQDADEQGAGGPQNSQVVTREHLRQLLGLADEAALLQMMRALAEQDPVGILRVIDSLYREGKDLRQFIRDLIALGRDLMLHLVAPNYKGGVLGAALPRQELLRLGELMTPERAMSMLPILSRIEADLRWAAQPRLTMEVGLLGLLFADGNPSMRKGTDIRRGTDAASDISGTGSGPRPATGFGSGQPAGREEPKSRGEDAGDEGFAQVVRQWRQVMERVKKLRRPLYALLEPGRPARIDGKKLILAFGREWRFHKEMVGDAANRTFLEKVIKEVTGIPLSITCVFEGEVEPRITALHKGGNHTGEARPPSGNPAEHTPPGTTGEIQGTEGRADQTHLDESPFDLEGVVLREFEGVLLDLDEQIREG